jgi:zinc/manganese transport system substrate-binding protein/manganese/iron transport system substrate-binding protein
VPNAKHYVENARDALVEADPEGAEQYEDNSEEYLAELEDLDGYIREQAQSIPEENRKLVTFHDGFPYFAQEYGFELVGVILQNPNAEASSREVAELTREVQEETVPAIFTEPQFNSGLADTIAQEAGVEVHPIYATFVQKGDIVEEDIDSYEEMMRSNIDNMVEGLG